MNFIKTQIDGVYIIEPKIFKDERGYFFESYNESIFLRNGIRNKFVQDNQSCSTYGVVRGLHAQDGKFAQAKLVRVLHGKVLDVAVDIRPESKTFGHYVAAELSADNQRQLFIPRGFLHGFSVLSPMAVFAYKCDNFYAPHAEIGVKYNDPMINVDWRVPTDKIIASQKDKNAMLLSELIEKQKIKVK